MKLLLTLLLSFHFYFGQKETVIICTGPKAYAYHSTANCRGLNRCSGQIISVDKSEAVRRHRTPCELCETSSVVPVRSDNDNSDQCRATTKKGTRCSRSARSNGYCWQHGG